MIQFFILQAGKLQPRTYQQGAAFAEQLADVLNDGQVVVGRGCGVLRQELALDQLPDEVLVTLDSGRDIGGRDAAGIELELLAAGQEEVLVVQLLEDQTTKFAEVLARKVLLVGEAA